MSTIKTTYIQHPSATDPAIELDTTGGAVLLGAGDAPSGSTGAPWNLPYPEVGDGLGTAAVQALAEATADGLDAAGGLVAVKHVLKTDTQSSSVAAGSSVAISGLTISHAVADDTNRVILIAQVGGASAFNDWTPALTAAGSLIAIGDAAGSRVRVGSQNNSGSTDNFNSMTLVAVHTPGVTSSITYGVSSVNVSTSTQTHLINRSRDDSSNGFRARGASSLILMEVKV